MFPTIVLRSVVPHCASRNCAGLPAVPERRKEKCPATKDWPNRGFGSQSSPSAARRTLGRSLSLPQQYPNIAVLPRATHATRIEYQRLSPRSASAVRPYGYEHQIDCEGFLGVVLARWP